MGPKGVKKKQKKVGGETGKGGGKSKNEIRKDKRRNSREIRKVQGR